MGEHSDVGVDPEVRETILSVLREEQNKQTCNLLCSKKIIIVFIGLLILIFLYWTRFQVVEIHADNGLGFYKINRLTGHIECIIVKKIYDVEKENDKK